MRQIAILAGLTLALVLLAVDGAAAEDCFATNCTVGLPQNVTESKSSVDPKLGNALEQLSKDTERALTAPKTQPRTDPTKPSEPPAPPGEQPTVRVRH
jgi:hypothetical protein